MRIVRRRCQYSVSDAENEDTVEVPAEKLDRLVEYIDFFAEKTEAVEDRLDEIEENVMASDEMSSQAHQSANDAAERVDETRKGQRRLKDRLDEMSSSVQENSFELQKHKKLLDELFDRNIGN